MSDFVHPGSRRPPLMIDFTGYRPIEQDPKLPARLACARSGLCPACKSPIIPADPTTFCLLGTRQPAHYRRDAWEGWRCTRCGNEIAIARVVA